MQYVRHFHEKYKHPEQKILLEINRSPRSILGYILAALCPILIGYIFVQIFESWSYMWLATGSLFIALEALRVYHDDLYVFDREKITHKGGRLSLTYEVPVIRYSDIRSIEVVQSVAGRLFDYGNISLGTASHEGEEMSIEGVRNPNELGIALDELRLLSTSPETRFKAID